MAGLFHLPLNVVKSYLGLPKLSEKSLLRWSELFYDTRAVTVDPDEYKVRGRRRAIDGDGEVFVEGCLIDDSTLYRSELQLELYYKTGVWQSLTSMQAILNDRLGYTCKKARRLHRKRSSKARADFTYCIGQYPASYLVFADESCVSQRGTERRNGWARAGERPERHTAKINGKNYSCLPFVSLEGVIECVVKVGSFKRKQFVWVLKNLVFPQLNRFPGPNSVLVLDNATIHHSPEIKRLARSFGVKLEYNAPYSPDFCPVEKGFAKMKASLRRNQRLFGATGEEILKIIEEEANLAMDGETMKRLYSSCGYF